MTSLVQQGVKAFRSTTIIAVLRDGRGAMAGDGQVTWGEATVMKHAARKVRSLAGGKVLAGFAGSAADGITLYEKFEEQLASFGNQLQRAAVELAKQWRSDKVLRRLDALMVVMDNRSVLVISGNGDVIEPDDGIAAIGSGGAYALAAARALATHTDQQPDEIVTNAMAVAADICVYTNGHLTLERLAWN